MQKKNNYVQLRISDKMDEWLEEQCETLGMNKSEVVRFWLQTSMLTFDKSVQIAKKAVDDQLKGQMSINDVIGK